MTSSKEDRSIIYAFRNRELGNGPSAYRTSLKIISKLIHSEDFTFKNVWHRKSTKPIVYENGLLHVDNYKKSFCIYGKESHPSKLYDFEPSNARKKVTDVITYGFPTYNSFETCTCGFKPCMCLSPFMLSLTEDDWINQHNLTSGKLLRNLYVKRTNCCFGFKYIDWNDYARQFTLTSVLNPHERYVHMKKNSDVLVNIAVFTSFPLEFQVLLEIKRSVFGNTCSSANVNENLLLLGQQSHRVHIYSFEDFLKGGTVTPYRIGEKYGCLGNIGEDPVGIPLNFQYYDAPPLLFDVQSYGHTLRFGGFPFHYITTSPACRYEYNIRSVSNHELVTNGTFKTNEFYAEPDVLTFHLDNSNRVIFKGALNACCYELKNINGKMALDLSFSMWFKMPKTEPCLFSSSGRMLKFINVTEMESSIFCLEHDIELGLICLLGIRDNDLTGQGYIQLYDAFTGAEIKTIDMEMKLNDISSFHLFFDVENIIVVENDSRRHFHVYLYRLKRL